MAITLFSVAENLADKSPGSDFHPETQDGISVFFDHPTSDDLFVAKLFVSIRKLGTGATLFSVLPNLTGISYPFHHPSIPLNGIAFQKSVD
ncbi:MAG: hypothetical protein IH613_17650 [Desulfuromonadales bacterium]|nr:hypothetical protein [Desulfuromonadales bacterium]